MEHKSWILAGFLFASSCGDVVSHSETKTEATDGTHELGQELGGFWFARFKVRLENVAQFKYLKSGGFNMPVGATSAGPIGPGNSYEFTVTAGRSHRLSLVSMLGISNDWFVGTVPEGIPLYVGGQPISGDVSSSLRLYDVGSEIDQEPGVGADTGPRQSSPDQGENDPNPLVREVSNPAHLSDGRLFPMPALSQLVKLTIQPTGNPTEFLVRFENISAAGAIMTSAGPINAGFSPGAYVVHSAAAPLFEVGTRDRQQGLADIAESGNIASLRTITTLQSGVATGFSPLMAALHLEDYPLFKAGQVDRGLGLEKVAEEGDTSQLATSLVGAPGIVASGVISRPVGQTQAGPIAPGAAYEFYVVARPSERLSFVSMYGASNDWVISTPSLGLRLFDEQGKPIEGDFSDSLALYDVGTELSEEPAVGLNGGAPVGAVDSDDKVRLVSPEQYRFPVSSHLRLTISRL